MLFLAPLLGLLATAAADPPTSYAAESQDARAVVPGAYFVQLKSDASLSTPLQERSTDHHALFHKRAADAIDYNVRTEFKNPNMFYGLSITVTQNLTSGEVQDKLLQVPDVAGVWPVYLVPRPTPWGTNKVNGTTKAFKAKAADDVPGGSYLPQISGDSYDPATALKQAGVDRVHALGIKGKGMKIGIIDTGVDYRHPALGGGFGPGFKIAGGYDFVGDDYDDYNDPVEDDDPLATCFFGGHGTHVSGIVGMQDPEGTGFGLVGVAPEAEIYMYRVFSCISSAPEDLIIRAMEKAGEDGVDVVSLSLGQPWLYQHSSPFSATTSGLAALGIATVVANGNDGTSGLHSTSAPAVEPDVIAVGSIANSKYPVTYIGEDSRGRDFKYAAVWPIDTTEPLDVYLLQASDPAGCSYSGYREALTKIDPTTTVVLVDGAACLTGIWVLYDLKYVALLNDNSGAFEDEYFIDPRGEYDNSQVIGIRSSDAATIRSMYAKAGGYGKYKWTFGNLKATSIKQDATGGMMSNFSSFGPPFDTLALKPQLSGPGGNILSLWPLGIYGGYTIISGTSMSTPFVAGCYALLKSQFPTLSVAELRAKLQSTSIPVSTVLDKSILSTTVHQGSGMINLYQAITFESTVFPSELSIGSTDDYLGKPRNFTITNHSTRSKTYIISHQGAGYVDYFPYPDITIGPGSRMIYGTPQYAKYGSASFSSNSVLLGAGQSATIHVSFTPPTVSALDETRGPISSGFIKITNNNDHFVIPYAGAPYSLFNAEYFDLTELTGVPYPGSTLNFVWPDPNVYDTGLAEFNFANYESPYTVVNHLHYTSSLRRDILPADTTFIPDKYGFDPSVTWDINLSNDTIGSVLPFAKDIKMYGTALNPGNKTDFFPTKQWWGWYQMEVMADSGETVTLGEGDYRILISIMRRGGDPALRKSWEAFLGPIVRMVNRPVPEEPEEP